MYQNKGAGFPAPLFLKNICTTAGHGPSSGHYIKKERIIPLLFLLFYPTPGWALLKIN